MSTTGVEVLPIYQQLEPYLVSAIGAIIVALGTWIATMVHKYTNYTVDAEMKKQFEQTAINAATQALAKLEGPIGEIAIHIDSPLVSDGLRYLNDHAKDAIAYFKFPPQRLREVILAKLGDAQVRSSDHTPPKTEAVMAAANPSSFNASGQTQRKMI